MLLWRRRKTIIKNFFNKLHIKIYSVAVWIRACHFSALDRQLGP